MNLWIFLYDLGKLLQVMEMSSFDSWEQTKTAHKYNVSKVITGEILKENTDAMSFERQFAYSWLAGIQCTMASIPHPKYYSTSN